jgi:hypothetical protein
MQPPPQALQEREKSVMGNFNVRNLMAFYSPVGPGIKHLSIKRATVMAVTFRIVLFSLRLSIKIVID